MIRIQTEKKAYWKKRVAGYSKRHKKSFPPFRTREKAPLVHCHGNCNNLIRMHTVTDRKLQMQIVSAAVRLVNITEMSCIN